MGRCESRDSCHLLQCRILPQLRKEKGPVVEPPTPLLGCSQFVPPIRESVLPNQSEATRLVRRANLRDAVFL